MRERANGDVVHPGKSILADIFEHNSTRRFNRDCEAAAAYDAHSLFHFRGRHVVEQKRFCTVVERFIQLVESAHFNIDRLPWLAQFMRPLKYLFDTAAQRNVVVLNEDAVREIDAVILAAAATDR